MRVIAALMFFCLCVPASAGFIDTPACRSKLARAAQLVDAVAARDRGVAPAGTAAICKVLAVNRRDMREATQAMQACLTGREKSENVGQMLASLDDVEAVLRQKCR